MALHKGNQQTDLKPLLQLRPLQKTAEQKNMMRRRHEDPRAPPRPLAPRPARPTPASPQHAHLGPRALPTGNQHPDPKPVLLLRPLQKTVEQKNMMR
jgi:hypothetical protein